MPFAPFTHRDTEAQKGQVPACCMGGSAKVWDQMSTWRSTAPALPAVWILVQEANAGVSCLQAESPGASHLRQTFRLEKSTGGSCCILLLGSSLQSPPAQICKGIFCWADVNQGVFAWQV